MIGLQVAGLVGGQDADTARPARRARPTRPRRPGRSGGAGTSAGRSSFARGCAGAKRPIRPRADPGRRSRLCRRQRSTEAQVVGEAAQPGDVVGRGCVGRCRVPGAEEAFEEGPTVAGQVVNALAARLLGLLVLQALVAAQLPSGARRPGKRRGRAARPAAATVPPPRPPAACQRLPLPRRAESRCCAAGPSCRRRANRRRAGGWPAAGGPRPGCAPAAPRPPRPSACRSRRRPLAANPPREVGHARRPALPRPACRRATTLLRAGPPAAPRRALRGLR